MNRRIFKNERLKIFIAVAIGLGCGCGIILYQRRPAAKTVAINNSIESTAADSSVNQKSPSPGRPAPSVPPVVERSQIAPVRSMDTRSDMWNFIKERNPELLGRPFNQAIRTSDIKTPSASRRSFLRSTISWR